MNVGVGGSGRGSMTKMATYMAEYECFQIELRKGYGYNEFREDLKQLFFATGCERKPTAFMFNDTQIVNESFLEVRTVCPELLFALN